MFILKELTLHQNCAEFAASWSSELYAREQSERRRGCFGETVREDADLSIINTAEKSMEVSNGSAFYMEREKLSSEQQ